MLLLTNAFEIKATKTNGNQTKNYLRIKEINAVYGDTVKFQNERN